MSKLERTMTPVMTRSPDALWRNSPAAVAGAVFLIAALLIGAGLVSGGFRQGVPGTTGSNVTDGWMHGTAAYPASGARRIDVTDGWAGRYLPSAQTVNVTDGWAGRYLPSAQTVNVTDGWAGRYLH